MRVLIVEDEILVRQRLLRLASEHTGGRMRFDAACALSEAEDRLARAVYDGVLLDLNLEGEDGFELLRRCCARAFHTIVVSAHTDRALEAFAHGVLDFVAKPFNQERLGLALDRLAGAAQHRPGAMRWLNVWRARGTALVSLDDVLAIRADGDHSEVMLAARSELHDKPLGRLISLLPADFVRCHRAWLVNLRHVQQFSALSGSRWQLRLSNGANVPVGRGFVSGLRAQLL
ncbi:MAG: response regulator transcription factor [Rhodanobacteraceae bacterium]|nr:response regulator transcription factor [Rhodanobacteraceae bacterium]